MTSKRSSNTRFHWLITAGPTQEPLDPVRFFGNAASGRLGIALARAACARGHTVTLICGPVAAPLPRATARCRVISVRTARDMLAACTTHARKADIIVMTAAVADYRPIRAAKQKIKKSQHTMTVTLVRNPDILTTLARTRTARQMLVGFALETHDMARHARQKLTRKKVDLIVANTPSAINAEKQQVTLYWSDDTPLRVPTSPVANTRQQRDVSQDAWPALSKPILAQRLLRTIETAYVPTPPRAPRGTARKGVQS